LISSSVLTYALSLGAYINNNTINANDTEAKHLQNNFGRTLHGAEIRKITMKQIVKKTITNIPTPRPSTLEVGTSTKTSASSSDMMETMK